MAAQSRGLAHRGHVSPTRGIAQRFLRFLARLALLVLLAAIRLCPPRLFRGGSMGLVYFADDDFDARALVKGCLKLDGHKVKCFQSGEELLAEFLQRPCDLVILDVMMPGPDGLEVLRRIRAVSDVPIIMLTAKDEEEDCFVGFSRGADDYIGKPFRPILLRGKVHALLSRARLRTVEDPCQPAKNLQCGNVRSEDGGKSFYVGPHALQLTPLERSYLQLMMENYDSPVPRERALEWVWGIKEQGSRVVDETNRRVRIKLVSVGANIALESVWGVGYVLRARKR